MAVTFRSDKGSPLTHQEMDNNIRGCLGIHNLLHVEDRKPAGTHGGTFTSGAWRTRDLNTVVVNNIAGASLASNQVTLPAGEYWAEVRSTVYSSASTINTIRSCLYDITLSEIKLMSDNLRLRLTAPQTTASLNQPISGHFVLTQESTLELQHRSETDTQTDTGFGSSTNFDVPYELYSILKIWKVG